jgi:plastocyanin
VTVTDDGDLPADDGNGCTAGSCRDGSAEHLPEPAGTACAQDGGAYCDGEGACVECTLPSHCPSGVCQDGRCRPAPCGNGTLDTGESDLDCGGDCAGCAEDRACTESSDCAGNQCELGACVANCADGVRNHGESAPDCGASCPGKACENGLGCAAHADCASGFCHPATSQCATPSCSDGVRNGTESGKDCGGTADGQPCPACPLPCTDNWECDHGAGHCYDGACVDDVNGCTQQNAGDFTNMVAASQTAPITIEFGDALGNQYSPRCIKVTMGSKIRLVGAFASHPLVGGIVDGAKLPASTGPFTTVTDSGSSKEWVMDDCASYPYYCDEHALSGMTGAVIVLLP